MPSGGGVEIENLKIPCKIIILLPTFISIREIIAIMLTMAKRTEVSSFSHGERYSNDLSDADNMLGHKNVTFCVFNIFSFSSATRWHFSNLNSLFPSMDPWSKKYHADL